MLVEGRPGGANHDSRSPFFSLLSLTYSKAIISSYFHYQTAGADNELRRTGVWMLFEEPAFGPAIRVIVAPNIAEEEIGRRPVHNRAHGLVDLNRPGVIVPGPVHPMKLQS